MVYSTIGSPQALSRLLKQAMLIMGRKLRRSTPEFTRKKRSIVLQSAHRVTGKVRHEVTLAVRLPQLNGTRNYIDVSYKASFNNEICYNYRLVKNFRLFPVITFRSNSGDFLYACSVPPNYTCLIRNGAIFLSEKFGTMWRRSMCLNSVTENFPLSFCFPKAEHVAVLKHGFHMM
jgi:hypothetical protein